jgi:hypothetical protein
MDLSATDYELIVQALNGEARRCAELAAIVPSGSDELLERARQCQLLIGRLIGASKQSKS